MYSLPEVKVILLSGGIGSGKSTAAAFLSSAGIPVYDADSRVKLLYGQCDGLVEALEKRLGTVLRDSEGRFDKKLLSACLFGTGGKAAITAVEEILFPYLLEDFRKFASAFSRKTDKDRPVYVAMESATVLEKEFFKDFGDFRIVVDAPYDLRLERACRRDGASREAILARMDQQELMNRISAGERIPGIDAVILNDSTETVLAERVHAELERLGIIGTE